MNEGRAICPASGLWRVGGPEGECIKNRVGRKPREYRTHVGRKRAGQESYIERSGEERHLHQAGEE
jgi:hypothetical protein